MAKSNKSSDSNKPILPSEVEGLRIQHNLTASEAERVAGGESVDTVKSDRVVYRPRYEAVEATSASHPLVAADEAAAAREAGAGGGKQASGPDPALPSSGPYGPNAKYEDTKAPEDKDHTSPAVPE